MNLSQRQLRMFVTTAALGNISRASESLHISQPALTRALQEFESQLGVALFRRTTRRLSLTDEGLRFLPAAQRLLRDMAEATQDLREHATGQRGTVTLAVGTAFGATLLPAALQGFTMQHPGVRLRVIDDNSAGITRRVTQAEVDIGVGSPVGETTALQCRRLLAAPLGLLAHPAHHTLKQWAHVADLERLPLLKESADTAVMQALRTHGSDVVAQMNAGMEVSNLSLQIALAQAGVGVAVVSALAASHPQAQGLKFAPLRPAVQREVFVMQRRDMAPSPAARALAEAIHLSTKQARLHPAVKLER